MLFQASHRLGINIAFRLLFATQELKHRDMEGVFLQKSHIFLNDFLYFNDSGSRS